MLDISEKTQLELSIEGDVLVIRLVSKTKKRSEQEIKKIAQEIMNEYTDVFEKLAK